MDASNDVDVGCVPFILLTSILFYYAPKIKSRLTTKVHQLLSPTKTVDPKVASLIEQIRHEEEELHQISPTSEFAAYFKKERQLNKLRDELTATNVNSPQESSTSTSSIKADLAMRFLFQIGGLLLLYLVSGYHAFCIDSSIFWPVNHMLRFPSVLSAGDFCGITDSDLIPVSYFVLFYLLTVITDRCTCYFIY